MLVPFPVRISSVSSTSQLLLQLPTVWTKRSVLKETSLFSILAAVPLMFPFSQLKTVSSKSNQLLVIPILVVKISITDWSITSSRNSRENTRKISLDPNVPSDVSELLVKEQRELFPVPPKPPLKSIHSSKVSTSTLPSPVPVLKNSVLIFSVVHSAQSKSHSVMPESTKMASTKSSSSAAPPVSQKSKNFSKITSTERNSTSPSTPMKPLPMVLPSKLLSSVVTNLKKFKIFSFLMLLHCLLVLKLPVVS